MSFKEFIGLFAGKTSDQILSEITLANEPSIKKGSEAGWVLAPTIPIPVYLELVNESDLNQSFFHYYKNDLSSVTGYIEENSCFLNSYCQLPLN